MKQSGEKSVLFLSFQAPACCSSSSLSLRHAAPWHWCESCSRLCWQWGWVTPSSRVSPADIRAWKVLGEAWVEEGDQTQVHPSLLPPQAWWSGPRWAGQRVLGKYAKNTTDAFFFLTWILTLLQAAYISSLEMWVAVFSCDSCGFEPVGTKGLGLCHASDVTSHLS